MRKSTIILGLVFLLLATLTACFLVGGTLQARISVVEAGASEHPEAFESIRQVLAAGAAPQVFDDRVPDGPEGLRLQDVTITLINRGLLDAEWLNVEVDGVPGDIAVYSLSGEGSSVWGRSTGTMNLKLISQGTAMGRRAYRIEYYVLGLKRHITVTED